MIRLHWCLRKLFVHHQQLIFDNQSIDIWLIFDKWKFLDLAVGTDFVCIKENIWACIEFDILLFEQHPTKLGKTW